MTRYHMSLEEPMPVNRPARIQQTLAVFQQDSVIDAAEVRALVELGKDDKGKIGAPSRRALTAIHNEQSFVSATVKGRLTAILLDAGVKAGDLSVQRSPELAAYERLGKDNKLAALFDTTRTPADDPWGNASEDTVHTLKRGFASVELVPARQLKGAVGDAAARVLADAKQQQKELLADWAAYDRDAGRDRHPNSLPRPTFQALVKNGETWGYQLTFTPKDVEHEVRRVFDHKMTLLGDVVDDYASM
jgi:hypothetical protein